VNGVSMFWLALLLGVVEGLTEFLPISSTGHLILTSHFVGFHGKRAEVFQVFIQLGAILSVVWEFRARLFRVVLELPTSPVARRFVGNLLIAFLPSAVVGLVLYDLISHYLFGPRTVAAALIAGALMIFGVESLHLPVRTSAVESVTWRQALRIGFAQCLALWPGFSRSAATILGGMSVGLSRPAATEFSFFLALPTMFAATFYDLFKGFDSLQPGDLGWLAISFLVSFLVAWGSIRWLLRFVAHHTFRPFAWYRLVLGVLILWLLR